MLDCADLILFLEPSFSLLVSHCQSLAMLMLTLGSSWTLSDLPAWTKCDLSLLFYSLYSLEHGSQREIFYRRDLFHEPFYFTAPKDPPSLLSWGTEALHLHQILTKPQGKHTQV